MSDIDKQVEIFLNSKPPLAGAFGYGSAFYKNISSTDKPQIDLFLVPEDIIAYHHANKKMHPEEYASLRKKDDDYFFTRHKSFDPGVYVTSYIRSGNYSIKTLTVAKEYFIDDCYNIYCNYIAGRMQKVPKEFRSTPVIQKALLANYRNALLFALTMCSDNIFTYEDLFKAIIDLSYNGDCRYMIRAESPTKKEDTLNEKYEEFLEVYNIDNSAAVIKVDEGEFIVDKNILLSMMNELSFIQNNNLVSDDINELREKLAKTLFWLTRKSSLYQLYSCINTVGVKNSIQYLTRKLKKGYSKPQQKI